MHDRDALIRSYDKIAREYAETFGGELDHKPYDRRILAELMAAVPAGGPICDMGCGPGHVAAYLVAQGANAMGVDLSPGMVECARGLHPEIDFQLGNMLDLDSPDESWAAVVALYSLIHLERDEVGQAMAEFHRVLLPGGRLLVGIHRGEDDLSVDEWFEKPVEFWCNLFEPEEIAAPARSAGFLDV